MTRYIASIIYDTSRNSRNLNSYRISLYPEDAECPWSGEVGRLIHSPPVWNNKHYSRGCFASQREALAAMLRSIDVPCVIRDNPEHNNVLLMPHGTKSRLRVLASHNANGDFFSA
jgi:hypothetical protein